MTKRSIDRVVACPEQIEDFLLESMRKRRVKERSEKTGPSILSLFVFVP